MSEENNARVLELYYMSEQELFKKKYSSVTSYVSLFLSCIRECFLESKYVKRNRNDYWPTQEIFSQ